MEKPRPIHYKIHLEPDLASFTFNAWLKVLFRPVEPVSSISLDSHELAVWQCIASFGAESESCLFHVNPKEEELTIDLPRDLSVEFSLKIDYAGRINRTMGGFYRSKFVEGGKQRYIAVTQFEESDARRAFPCFDHPAFKATFDIEMVIPRALTAISNMPVLEQRSLGDGKKFVKFLRTPKMSTYLLFFGVGKFSFTEDSGDVTVRVATVPGRKRYARYALDFGRKSLQFCQEYYASPYPLPKLDLIAIPDFAFGAMENWGAITFRENLLLRYPRMTSKAGEENICVVIAHEMAHQWFGNLVTPSDWKYLWLNESFATYFGYGVVDHFHPEWDVWDQFTHSQTDTALHRDAFVETFPIEIPGGEHVIINASTAPIIYNKGGSILRQIEGYIGKKHFKMGLRTYLREHAYDCASSHHLWEALEAASEEPVSEIMESWIGKVGYPIVRAKRDGDKLLLTQDRFTYLPHHSEGTWLIPVTVRVFRSDGSERSATTLLREKTASVDLGPNATAYKINEGQSGFYRVQYEEKAVLDELGRRISSGGLSPQDRWGLQNDLYALLRSGEVTLDDYLSFLDYYKNESGFLPLTSIRGNLYDAYLIGEALTREKIASIGRPFFEGLLTKIGRTPSPNERHTTSLLRDQVIYPTVLFGSKETEEFALDCFSSLVNGGRVHPDITRSIMQVAALRGEDRTLGWFISRLESSEIEHERMNILSAMGRFAEKGLIERSLRYVLEKVPDRNKFVSIVSTASNPFALELLWKWYVSHLGTLEKFHPVHYERVIAAIVPFGGLGREQEVKGFFQGYMEKKEMGRDIIRLSLEKLEVNARMRKAFQNTSPRAPLSSSIR